MANALKRSASYESNNSVKVNDQKMIIIPIYVTVWINQEINK
jgi:hypothetical protein